ncbi:MAG: hypothetical protein DHS20C17_23390 [Cyclobacteriaceae bacterium]|nr:MAG: hypothetical protein DHS20C17_23390 [Cyclobacteriaceae bacterium]
MTKLVDRSHLIDQLEDLKQGLTDILSSKVTPQLDTTRSAERSPIPETGKEHANQDVMLLEQYQIINTARELLNSKEHKTFPEEHKHGNQVLILLDRNCRLMAFNNVAAASILSLTGIPLQYGAAIEDYLPKNHTEEIKSLINQGLEGTDLHLTSQLGFDKHPKKWYEINLLPVKRVGEKIERLVWCMEDIAERKIARQNLKALEINFQSVFKQAAVSVILSNINLQVIQANHKFYELIEYTPREFKALPPLSTTHPRDLAESKRLLRLLCSGEMDSFSLEKRLITKTGRVVWVYLTTNIVKDQKGKPKLIISVAQDVTDRKHAEQELMFKSNELDTFIYRASHDLRGPVASLMGLFNVVQSEFKEDSYEMEYFRHYHRSVQRLNKILHNLIDLTKIKEKDVMPSEVALDDIISDCLAAVSTSENFEKIHFKIRNEIDFKLNSDTSSLRTILFHLLENAVNFMQFDTPQPFVKLEIKHESSFLIIEVTDNGQGIKKELQSEVFNMFYRANERSTGSGLGLYIVRYAVEKLNGSIQLKSKELSGTKISVYIPYTKVSSTPEEPQNPEINTITRATG